MTEAQTEDTTVPDETKVIPDTVEEAEAELKQCIEYLDRVQVVRERASFLNGYIAFAQKQAEATRKAAKKR
jgi:hypothetical protein